MTEFLRDKNVRYRWGFPFRLICTWDGEEHVIRNVEEGRSVLVLPRDPPANQEGPVPAEAGRSSRWTTKRRRRGAAARAPSPRERERERSALLESLQRDGQGTEGID